MVRKENTINKHVGALSFSLHSLPSGVSDDATKERIEMVDAFLEARFSCFLMGQEYNVVREAISSRYVRKAYYISSNGNDIKEYLASFEKSGLDYFDFHSINVNFSRDLYLNLPVFFEEKKKGRIKHLGMKYTGSHSNFNDLLAGCHEIEYVILPLSFNDFISDSDRKKNYETARENRIPIIIESPVSTHLEESFSPTQKQKMHLKHPSWPAIAWNLRFLHSLEGVITISIPFENVSTLRAATKTLKRYHSLSSDELHIIGIPQLLGKET